MRFVPIPNLPTNAVLVYLFVMIILPNNLPISFGLEKCSTPPEWLEDNLISRPSPVSSPYNSSVEYKLASDEEKAYRHRRKKESLWPNNIVTYYVNTSTTPREESETLTMLTNMAIDEFEQKTCIRFRKWNGLEASYVSIEKSSSLDCGRATVCKRKVGGYQYAQIGPSCFNKATVVHELGHTLCLSHEHLRSNRDEYLNFSKCEDEDENGTKLEPPKPYKVIPDLGIYDYASQMHYSCSCSTKVGESKNKWWSKCGEDIPGNDGLSLMDADMLNYLYDCQGCHRHRWTPLEILNETEEANMYNFGYADHLGRNVYICRSLFRGEVAVGTLLLDERRCRIPTRFNKGRGWKRRESIEVLTIPGGLGSATGCGSGLTNGLQNERSLYEFVNIHSVDSKELMKRAVRAGNGWTENREQFQISFIAVGSLTWNQFENNSSDKEVVAVDMFGSAWVDDGKVKEARFTTMKGKIVTLRDFKVLVCK